MGCCGPEPGVALPNSLLASLGATTGATEAVVSILVGLYFLYLRVVFVFGYRRAAIPRGL